MHESHHADHHDNEALSASQAAFELRFRSLFNTGRSMSFPCDRTGAVNLQAMSPSCSAHYPRAQDLVGRDFATPVVVRVDSD